MTAARGVESAGDAAAEYEALDQFWVEEEDCDSSWHYYRQGSTSGAPAAAPTHGTAFTRIAQKQWKLLQAGLPKGIYCCAFEERADLLRNRRQSSTVEDACPRRAACPRPMRARDRCAPAERRLPA